MTSAKEDVAKVPESSTGSGESTRPNLQALAAMERRLRKVIVGEKPPSPEELRLNSDPLDGTKYEVANNTQQTGDKLREWWRAVSDVWLAYAREAAEQQKEDPVAELALIMGRIAGELSLGIVPPYVADVVVRGNPPASYWEIYDIGVAVAYRQASGKQGLLHNSKMVRVNDRHPTKTIAQAYGVHKTTVQGWCRKFPPAFLGVNEVTADVLKTMLKQSGARYKKAGRSHSAIARRNAKG
jgi:hypothetical protein